MRCLLSVPTLFSVCYPSTCVALGRGFVVVSLSGRDSTTPPHHSLHCPRPADVTADYYIYNTDTSIPGVGMSAQQSGGLLTQSHTNYGFMTNNPQVGAFGSVGRVPVAVFVCFVCVFCLCVVNAELGGSVCWM